MPSFMRHVAKVPQRTLSSRPLPAGALPACHPLPAFRVTVPARALREYGAGRRSLSRVPFDHDQHNRPRAPASRRLADADRSLACEIPGSDRALRPLTEEQHSRRACGRHRSEGRSVAAEFTMLSEWSRRQRRLLAAIVLTVVIVLGDIIVLNVMGEVPSAFWILAVPVGLLIVPVIGVVCSVLLVAERRQA